MGLSYKFVISHIDYHAFMIIELDCTIVRYNMFCFRHFRPKKTVFF